MSSNKTVLADDALIERHGLTREEYQQIIKMLGHVPTLTELGIFSVMWSEHCSYKSSRVHLQTLPTSGPRVLQGPGENAGAVDIGNGLAAVFKIESHNHPSFIEPYQGAATGVGGIIRDIFTMGARPIALLNSLRFGLLKNSQVRRLFAGVVAGIGGYGNSIGIPTVGGEVGFDKSYAGNPLVNVFCLGIAKADEIIKAAASGAGNPVYYVGAKTGRDGIHGATMASAEFDESSAEKRPAVQVGDPFMEKLLLEACLEAMKTNALVGIQDMGAAGLTCSTCEMGSRGDVGIEIDVSLVPQRETGMTPYEIMLSESQERMLLVVKQGHEEEIEQIFEKWDLHAVQIGQVTTDGKLRVKDQDVIVADIPNRLLTEEAPIYHRPTTEPDSLGTMRNLTVSLLEKPRETLEIFRQLLRSPNVASKRFVYRQYDYMVRTNTIVSPGMGTGTVRVKGTNHALAMSVDCNARYVALDPYAGTQLALAEAARNVACTGALPIGATNCLNFGNPERPEIMWQFARAVEGLGSACRALEIPITGGNVSLYNETDGESVLPTPVIGVIGLLDQADKVVSRRFQKTGDVVVLLGEGFGELGGSEYLELAHGLIRGVPPTLDLERERALQRLLVDSAAAGLIKSAHDCAEGGIGIALAECTFDSGLGVEANIVGISNDLSETPFAEVATVFGESASRVVVSVEKKLSDEFLDLAAKAGVASTVIGRVGGSNIRLSIDGHLVIDEPQAEAERIWATALDEIVESPRAVA